MTAVINQPPDIPFDQDPERSYTIASRFYLDADIYEQEKEAIFYRNWWYAGHQSQLAEPGCYLTVQILEQSIIVIRNKSGDLKAYYNVCQHRGHELLSGSGVVVCISLARSFIYCGGGDGGGTAVVRTLAGESAGPIESERRVLQRQRLDQPLPDGAGNRRLCLGLGEGRS